VLGANGFPDIERAHIRLPGKDNPGGPAVVTPRSTGKGGPGAGGPDQGRDRFIGALLAAPEYVNPAIKLAAEAMRAESDGDADFIDRALRSGALERAIADGSREGRDCLKALRALGHASPVASNEVPAGF
jgi:hypothetical protein